MLPSCSGILAEAISVLIVSLRFSLSLSGKINFPWDFLDFPESADQILSEIRIREKYKDQTEKVFFSGTFEVPKKEEQFKELMEFKGWWPPSGLKTDLLITKNGKNGLAVFAHLKENLPVVFIAYSCCILSSYKTPKKLLGSLELFF